MAHNLYRNTMAWTDRGDVRDVPWHKLGTRVPEGQNDIYTMARAAAVDFETVAEPLYLGDGVQVPNARAIMRRPQGDHALAVFGIATEQYQILQNVEALEAIADWVKDGRLMVETMGAFGQGERMWALMRLGEDLLINGADPVRPYVMFTNSHDGRSSALIRDTATRVVCANTFAVAMRETPTRALALRHTASIVDRIRDADRALGLISKTQAAVAEALGRLADIPAGEAELAGVADLIFPVPSSDKATDRQIKKAKDDRYGLFLTYRDSGTIDAAQRGTRYGIFNAVTEFIDHRQSRRGQDWDSKNADSLERRSLYSLEGEGAEVRQKVFAHLRDLPVAAVR